MSLFDGFEIALNSPVFCDECGDCYDSPIELWAHQMSWCNGQKRNIRRTK